MRINSWITRHIKYDVRGYRKHRIKTWKTGKILRRRKGLCREYSLLYDDMCKAAGIPSFTIPGYGKDHLYDEGDWFFVNDHCWNMSKINGRWHLQDLTWASGYVGAKYNLWLRVFYKIKLRRYPFKMVFVRRFNPDFVFASPSFLAMTHFPNQARYQLLGNSISIQEFANIKLLPDSMEAFMLHHGENENTECNFCDAQLISGKEARAYTESKQHLEENPTNSFDFVHGFVPYDIKFRKTGNDTSALKEEILKYDSLLAYTACAGSSIREEWHFNNEQNKNKNRWFKYSYNKPLEKNLRDEKKLLKVNRRRIRSSLRYLTFSGLKINRRYLVARAIDLQGVVPSKLQSKRDKKLLQNAEREADKHFSVIEHLFDIYDENDARLKRMNAWMYNDYVYSNSILEEQAGQQLRICVRRKAFDDAYDHFMLFQQDSILSGAQQASQLIHSLDKDSKFASKALRRCVDAQITIFSNFIKLKKDLRNMAQHDVKLKEYREIVNLMDSLLLLEKEDYSACRQRLKNELKKQNALRKELREKNKWCRDILEDDYFYHQCRDVFFRRYSAGDCRVKQYMLSKDRAYIRNRLKENKQLLKKERRKAEQEKKKKTE